MGFLSRIGFFSRLHVSRITTYDDFTARWKKEHEERIASTTLYDRVIDRIKYHHEDTKKTIGMMKRFRKMFLGAKKTIYLSCICVDEFEPCPKRLDPKSECKCSMEGTDVSPEEHYDGKVYCMDVYAKNDRFMADYRWVFVVDTEKAAKQEEELNKEYEKDRDMDWLKSETEDFEIEGVKDVTVMVLPGDYYTSDQLCQVIKGWIKRYFKRDLEVVWVPGSVRDKEWDRNRLQTLWAEIKRCWLCW